MLIFGLIVRGENHGLAGGLETNWLTPETLVPSQFPTGSRHFGTETALCCKSMKKDGSPCDKDFRLCAPGWA